MEVIFKEVGTHLNNNALKKLEKKGAVIIRRGNKIDLEIDLKVKDKELVLRILGEVCNIIFG